MSTDKTQKLLAELYRKPEQFITAVDKIIESNKKFAEQVRNGTFSSETATKGTPRLYMTQMQEFEKFQQFSKDKNPLKIQYALTISDLANQPGLLQPPATPDIHLKDLPITAVGTHDPTNPVGFWNRYNPLSAENKAKVDERLLTVLDMQAAAFENLRFHLDSKKPSLQESGLKQGNNAIERRAKLIKYNQRPLEQACDEFKELAADQKKHIENNRKMSAEAKVLYPSAAKQFASSLSHVRHKMSSAVKEVSHTAKAMAYSAHSFFAKKSPVNMKPTFVSHVSLEEEMPVMNNASRPSFSP